MGTLQYPRRLYKYNYPCTELLNKTGLIGDTLDLIITYLVEKFQASGKSASFLLDGLKKIKAILSRV